MSRSDLQLRHRFIGIIGNPQQQKNAAFAPTNDRKRIQGLVGRAVVLKYTPNSASSLDESDRRGNRVLEIIEEL